LTNKLKSTKKFDSGKRFQFIAKTSKGKMILNDCTVAIIAGGRSKRFGSPKFKAKIGNKRLIELVLDLAYRISTECMIISGLEEIREQFNLPVFDDVFPQCGPLAGIHSALVHAKTEWIAILPVDMPLLKESIYLKLWTNRRDNVPVAARTDRGLEPMVSLWHQSAIPTIQNALENRKFKIHQMLETLHAVFVLFPLEENIHFFNVNYPNDLQLIRSLVKGDKDE